MISQPGCHSEVGEAGCCGGLVLARSGLETGCFGFERERLRLIETGEVDLTEPRKGNRDFRRFWGC